MIRKPVVAGRFYPENAGSLRADIERMLESGTSKRKAVGVVSPHAGYPFSGPVAGAVLSRIEIPDTFVIMGPNHAGMGSPFSIMVDGKWETPLGQAGIDSELGASLLEGSNYLVDDPSAHGYEHSIEVQIPFLLYLKEDIKIVPIIFAHASGEVYKQIGKEIAASVRSSGKKVALMASSDMTHYEPYDVARAKDMKAIDAILELNADELVRRVDELAITMCGYGPTVALISAARDLGAKEAELVRYQTSGDVTGDYGRVVGYAGVIIQ
ncbi:MAG: MEMO1 family protein [Dehalococcoidia bacterium]